MTSPERFRILARDWLLVSVDFVSDAACLSAGEDLTDKEQSMDRRR